MSSLILLGEPRTRADPERHECLGMLKTSAWTLRAGKRTATVPVGGRFTLNSVGMIRRRATLNMGIMLVPEEIVTDELASGALRRNLPEWHGNPDAGLRHHGNPAAAGEDAALD